jgi:predicted ATPase
MNASPLSDTKATELDPDLLATPFGVQTNWHVITGAICCGKTTLIDLLADKGFQTLPETSRQYIEREVAKGRTLDEIFGSEADERANTEMQRRAEHRLGATDVTFLDRALPDYLWFWRLFGMDPNELLAECFHHRYASVFILDQLPLELDGARIEDEAYTALLDEALVRDYSALGYRVMRVPVLSPQERVEFVLERLSEQGLL